MRDLRSLAACCSLAGVSLLSVLTVVGHLAVFLVAARTAGVPASPARLLPLALLVLLAMAVPANVAGWGPREGVAAWVFAAAGLGASAGLATAVAYGVLVLVASLPGVAVLVAGRGVDGAAATHVGSTVSRRLEAPWLTVPTPCSAAACRSTATSTAPGEDRVLFSNDADFDRVDAVRAGCDAILVGAATVRNDDPRLLVRDPARRARRVARGHAPRR